MSSEPIVWAKRDPVGARQALWRYGQDYGWPKARLGVILFEEGEDNWKRALASAPPLALGLAWESTYWYSGERPNERGALGLTENGSEDQMKKGDDVMPVLPWKEYTGLEPGIYPARVSEIVETEGQFGPQLQFQFVVLDDQGHDTPGQIRGWCSASWGAKSKLYSWAKVMLRQKCPKDSEPLDTDLLAGRKVDLEVGAKGDGKSFLKEVYPFRTMSAKDDDSAPF